MSLAEQRLRETVGLDASALGPTSLARAVQLEMKRLDIKETEAYHRLLEQSPSAWTHFLEAVLVTETWFFREPEAFETLSRLVLSSWLPFHDTGTLRLLSLPCASGEEPYSAVMALLDAGLRPNRFQVDAVDISSNSLAVARRAVYGKKSFRNGRRSFQERYFRSTKDGYVLDALVRERVRFSEGNLLDPGFGAAWGAYDFIFFRNLLIYLEEPARQRALQKIAAMLAPAGVLFVGPAEQSLLLDYGFESASLPFAYRKAGDRPGLASRRLTADSTLPCRPVAPAPKTNFTESPPVLDFTRPRAGGARRSLPEDLECARRLAEAGRLAEAEALCEAHLSQSRTSAQAYYLLGVVRDAAGHANAIDYFRKAVYLEPNHYESLMRMALLASRNGDTDGARNFRRRAERLKALPPVP